MCIIVIIELIGFVINNPIAAVVFAHQIHHASEHAVHGFALQGRAVIVWKNRRGDGVFGGLYCGAADGGFRAV